MTLYQDLAQNIMSNIDSGEYSVGQKMPSIRMFSQQHGVSINTALNCYELLQEKGYIQSKPKSGYFVNLPYVKSAVMQLPYFESKVMKTDPVQPDKQFHPFVTGQLAPELIPYKPLIRCQNSVQQRHGPKLMAYGHTSGELQLKTMLATHFTKQGFIFNSDDLVINNGALDAVRIALEVTTQPGDTVAVSSPCFNGILMLLQALGRKVLEVPSTDEGIAMDQLEHYMSLGILQACVVTANHQNPLGNTWSLSQKKKMAELANQYQIPVIEDDLYIELVYQDVPPLPIKHWDQAGYIIWCSSVSKTLAPGFRLGWCLAGRYKEQYLLRRRVETLGVNRLSQLTLAEYIGTGQYDKHLKKLRLQLAAQIQEYRNILAANLPQSAAISLPHGGLVIWVQIPGLDTQELSDELENREIYIRTGAEFSLREFYGDFFRVSCGWPLDETRKTELLEICDVVKQML